MILIGFFIGNDQWIYFKRRIRIRWRGEMKRWGDLLIDSLLTIQGRNMTFTQNRSKKLLKNKNMCTIYIFLFTQLSLSLSLSPPISHFSNAIAKNQTIFFFFFLLFWQCHYHKPIATNFFFSLLFRQCHCNKFIPPIFFSLYFGNDITTN